MESPTFSSFEKTFSQAPLTVTAALLVLGNIAYLPPSRYNLNYPKPNYSIEANLDHGGSFMDIIKSNEITNASIDANSLPFGTNAVQFSGSFAFPLIQGISFIGKMAFIAVDNTVNQAIETHFSVREIKTRKLFINPYKNRHE